jgi:hypothetical protein
MVAFPAVAVAQRRDAPTGGLAAFKSEDALRRYLTDLARRADEQRSPQCRGASASVIRVAASQKTDSGAIHINGRVQSAGTQQRISSARVVAGMLNIAASTNDTGAFALTIPSGKIAKADTLSLSAMAIGYERLRTTVTAAPGDSLRITFRMCQAAVQLQEIVLTAAGSASSITNVQHAGVDEGDIVKLAGRFLVILRRGRLFTVSLDGTSPAPVSMADAFGPGVDPNGTWYDELLVYRDKVVVVGYSYSRGGTEIGLFRLDTHGELQSLGTYNLRSNDYYSSRNYASRLIGGKLIFYAPLEVAPFATQPLAALPAMRRWQPGATAAGFQPIATTRTIFQPGFDLEPGDVALHTVTTCDLDSSDFSCEATVVVGPRGRVFYMSPRAVYVWTAASRRPAASTLFRLPLDGSGPAALQVEGSPIDQFSFLETDDGRLNVVVRSDGRGDGMWRAERGEGDLALLRTTVSAFSDGKRRAPASAYMPLPAPRGGGLENRFVGDRLLYGEGDGWGAPRSVGRALFVVNTREGSITETALPHAIDRIEPLGENAVVVGSDSSALYFTGILLGSHPVVMQRYVMQGATQGELRSHGFIYRADSSDAGILGLPTRGANRPGWAHLVEGSASVVFIRNQGHRFEPLGELAALAAPRNNDGCRASCVDWYGNARPVFIGDRVFALLGYELVEGRLRRDFIEETARINFGPQAQTGGRR